MSDESQLQVTPKDGGSSLSLSKIRVGLIARGRRDAALLGKPSDPEPMDWLSETRRQAEKGDADAQYDLTIHYFATNGSLQGTAEFLFWLRKAADQDHDLAQTMLGEQYEMGYDGGLVQDYSEAVRWYQRAAELGNTYAQVRLGWACYGGKGITQDYAEAVRLFRRAAELGDPAAQFALGLAYYYGKGVALDKTNAVLWYRKGVAQKIAFWDREFVGFSQDLAEAAEQYRQAARKATPEQGAHLPE